MLPLSLPTRRKRLFVASQSCREKEHRLNDKKTFSHFSHLQVDYFNRGLIDRGLDSHISDPAVQLKNADTFYKYLGWEVSNRQRQTKLHDKIER